MSASRRGRVGLLIVRAWFEGSEERLIAKITQTSDVAERHATNKVVGDVLDLHEALDAWLDAIARPEPHDDSPEGPQ
jgi:hypothetical protein